LETDARSAGVAVKPVHRSHRDPYRAILDVAEHERCDVIVMAPHESGFTVAQLGSETMKVLTHTNIPVLVYRQS
jgi:nucleotide-binding universal stress UspA family protein